VLAGRVTNASSMPAQVLNLLGKNLWLRVVMHGTRRTANHLVTGRFALIIRYWACFQRFRPDIGAANIRAKSPKNHERTVSGEQRSQGQSALQVSCQYGNDRPVCSRPPSGRPGRTATPTSRPFFSRDWFSGPAAGKPILEKGIVRSRSLPRTALVPRLSWAITGSSLRDLAWHGCARERRLLVEGDGFLPGERCGKAWGA